jgi:hypothetical protein
MKSPTFTSPGGGSSAAGGGGGGGRTRSGTLWSEYDSGISATSPRPFGTLDPEIVGGPLSPLYAGKDQQGEENVGLGNTLSPTSSRPSSSQRGGRREGPMTSSVKTTSNTISLARLEERPRSLLFPATPAQLAAQKIKERNASSGGGHHHHQHHHHDRRTSKPGARRHHDDVLEEEDDEVAAALRPPMAPFNPMYSSDRRAGSPSSSIKAGKGKARDSGEHLRMYTHSGQHGRRQSTHSHPGQGHSIHLQGDGHAAKSVSGLQHAGSSVFSGADMGYLPSRWARGEREFRAGEEELDKYRPMEFRGTREDHKEPEWR